jgi:flagellar biosynthetic protein FliS
MDQKLRNFYIESQIKNASPGQHLIMLYDGLIESAETADTEMASPDVSKDPSPASRAVTRCIDILTELNICLRPSVEPALCATLSDLYLFFTREFSQAFDQRDPKKIRAILPLLRSLRGAWYEADRRTNQFQPKAVTVAA